MTEHRSNETRFHTPGHLTNCSNGRFDHVALVRIDFKVQFSYDQAYECGVAVRRGKDPPQFTCLYRRKQGLDAPIQIFDDFIS